MKKSSRVRKDLEFGILVESYVDSRSQNVCSFFRFCNSSRHVNGDASGILLYLPFGRRGRAFYEPKISSLRYRTIRYTTAHHASHGLRLQARQSRRGGATPRPPRGSAPLRARS